MPTNAKQFKLELAKSVPALEGKLVIFHRKISMELLTRIVMGNPVRTGRSRGSWQTGTSTNETNPAEIRDPSIVLQSGASALSSLQAYAVVYIWNNVRYIVFLEDGTSQQAPRGFVKVSIDGMRGIIEKAEVDRL